MTGSSLVHHLVYGRIPVPFRSQLSQQRDWMFVLHRSLGRFYIASATFRLGLWLGSLESNRVAIVSSRLDRQQKSYLFSAHESLAIQFHFKQEWFQ